MRPAESVLFKAGNHNKYWGRVIIDAERTDGFSPQDLLQSGAWVTCACGKLDKAIPRETAPEGAISEGKPIDDELTNLGELFCTAVAQDAFVTCAELLGNIERRAIAVILEQVLKASGIPELSTTHPGG